MRCAIPHPCIDSRASVLKTSKSRVPCRRSVVGISFPSSFDKRMHGPPVECQGVSVEQRKGVFGRRTCRVETPCGGGRSNDEERFVQENVLPAFVGRVVGALL